MKKVIPLVAMIFAGFMAACAAGEYADQRPAAEGQAVITINAENIIRPVSKNVLGTSVGALHRAQWRVPADFDDPNLATLFNELRPGFINLENTMLGLPFYPESAGEFSERLSFIETLERMGITSDPLGRELYEAVDNERDYYGKPPHKNYDDVLQFFERLEVRPEISIRIPTIFTTLLGPESYDGLDLAQLAINLDPKTGSDLVHYLNDDATTELGKLRAQNGHPEPYNVKYFVLGNELWVNYQWHNMSIEQIASQHIAFYNGMKQADPTIKIGHNLVDDAFPHEFFRPEVASEYGRLLDYNDKVLSQIKDHLNFVTFHDYGYGIQDSGETVDLLNEEDWKYVMAQNYLREKYDLAGRHRDIVNAYNDSLEIIVDEFSGPAGSLGGALYNADYMIYLLNHEYAFIANWNSGLMEPHTKWGLIRVWENNDQPMVRRPNYYVLKMFTHYFGDSIVETTVESPTFSTGAVEWEKYFLWPAEQNIPGMQTIASVSAKDGKLYLMVVNREMNQNIRAEITLHGFTPGAHAKVYTLNGSSMNASNEENPNNVVISESAIDNAADTFFYTFENHSVTVIELTAAGG